MIIIFLPLIILLLFQVNSQQIYTNIEEIHDDHFIEINRLRQENEQLRKENNQLQRIQEMAQPNSNYGGLQNRGLQNSQNPWDKSKLFEPGFKSQSVHDEVAELKHKLEQTQNELQLHQGNYKRCQKELEQMQDKVFSLHFS